MKVFKSEKDLEDYVISHIQNLEEGLNYISRQVSIGIGKLDILAIDKNRNLCGIELKNRIPTDQIIGQCEYYLENCRPLNRLIVVAPDYLDSIIKKLSSIEKVEVRNFDFVDEADLITFTIDTTKLIKPMQSKKSSMHRGNKRKEEHKQYIKNEGITIKDKIFSERLISLRERMNLRQDEAAKLMEMPNASLNAYESGRGRKPKESRLVKIADFYNVTVDYLLGRDYVVESSDNLKSG